MSTAVPASYLPPVPCSDCGAPIGACVCPSPPWRELPDGSIWYVEAPEAATVVGWPAVINGRVLTEGEHAVINDRYAELFFERRRPV